MSASAEPIKIEFAANPTQRLFIESKAKADLFACRMGEGKSAALVWCPYYHTLHNRGAKWAIIRDTWENLRDTTQQEFFAWFQPGIMGEYKASTKTFRWNVGEMEGEVIFIGMDDPADAAKLQSRPLAGFAIDEPAPAAESGGVSEFVFDTAMTRLRQIGMKWYSAKLAENNPDELHWTYRRFVDPDMKTPGFEYFQTREPENLAHLPENYYHDLEVSLAHRPDLLRRFVKGHFGFQRQGMPVTPQWSDDLHLAENLQVTKGIELVLCWDFGLNPTCIISQITPLGHWNVLEAYVGEEIGTYELIATVVKPRLTQRFEGFPLRHVGDPSGKQREQSSVEQSAVKVIRDMIGGPFRPGPPGIEDRVDPLQWVLSQTRHATGLLRVDKNLAKPVWHALRGGWYYHVGRTGIPSATPVKNIHSHPGDALAYGAARLFPRGRLVERRHRAVPKARGTYWKWKGLGFERPGSRIPEHGEELTERKVKRL